MPITAHHMGNTCTPNGYHMHTTWVMHAHHMGDIFTPHGDTCTPHGYTCTNGYHMHTTWVTHVHHMGITCTPHAYHMHLLHFVLLVQIDYPEIAEGVHQHHRFMSAYESHTTCLSLAHHMGNTCTPHGYHMHTTWYHMNTTWYHMNTTWVTHVHHMPITCAPHGITWTPHAFITCTPHRWHMYTTWVSHAHHVTHVHHMPITHTYTCTLLFCFTDVDWLPWSCRGSSSTTSLHVSLWTESGTPR